MPLLTAAYWHDAAPRLVIAAVYQHTGEEMKFLWNKDMRINTVHVRDVCRALVHLCSKGKVGEVYNLADKGDTGAWRMLA